MIRKDNFNFLQFNPEKNRLTVTFRNGYDQIWKYTGNFYTIRVYLQDAQGLIGLKTLRLNLIREPRAELKIEEREQIEHDEKN